MGPLWWAGGYPCWLVSYSDYNANLLTWLVSGSLSQTMTQEDTELVSATQCGVSDSILCTSADTTGCQGDLGGPLLQGDNLLIGAVASDKGCANGGYGIFTQVSSKLKNEN